MGEYERNCRSLWHYQSEQKLRRREVRAKSKDVRGVSVTMERYRAMSCCGAELRNCPEVAHDRCASLRTDIFICSSHRGRGLGMLSFLEEEMYTSTRILNCFTQAVYGGRYLSGQKAVGSQKQSEKSSLSIYLHKKQSNTSSSIFHTTVVLEEGEYTVLARE